MTTLASQLLPLVPSWQCCAFIPSVHDHLGHVETAVWQFTKQFFCAQSQKGEQSLPTRWQLKLCTLLFFLIFFLVPFTPKKIPVEPRFKFKILNYWTESINWNIPWCLIHSSKHMFKIWHIQLQPHYNSVVRSGFLCATNSNYHH